MNTVTLSVIVPVYNGGNTLKQCIRSIVGQTYTDFELIIVNDGSADESLAIAEQYAKEDARVRVLTQENKGVSAAEIMVYKRREELGLLLWMQTIILIRIALMRF